MASNARIAVTVYGREALRSRGEHASAHADGRTQLTMGAHAAAAAALVAQTRASGAQRDTGSNVPSIARDANTGVHPGLTRSPTHAERRDSDTDAAPGDADSTSDSSESGDDSSDRGDDEPWMRNVLPESARVRWPIATLARELCPLVFGDPTAVMAHDTATVIAGRRATEDVDPGNMKFKTVIDALKLNAPWGALETITAILPRNEHMSFTKPTGRRSHMGRGRRSTWRLCKLVKLDAWLYMSGNGAMAVQQVVADICSTWSTGVAEGKGYRLEAKETVRGHDGADGRPARGSTGFIYSDARAACGKATAATWLRRLTHIDQPDASLRWHIIGTGQDAEIGDGKGDIWNFMKLWHQSRILRVHGSCAVCVECTLAASDDGLFLDARSDIVSDAGVAMWPTFGLARLVNVNGRVRAARRQHVSATLFQLANKLNWYSSTVVLFNRRTSPAQGLRASCTSGIGSESKLRRVVDEYISAMEASTTDNRVCRVPLRLEQTVSMRALMNTLTSLEQDTGRPLERCVQALARELVWAVWPAILRVDAHDFREWVACDNARAALTLKKVIASDAQLVKKVAAVRAVAAMQLFKHDGGFDPVGRRSDEVKRLYVRVLEGAQFDPHVQRKLGQESGWWEPRASVLRALAGEVKDATLEDADIQAHRAAPTRHGGAWL